MGYFSPPPPLVNHRRTKNSQIWIFLSSAAKSPIFGLEWRFLYQNASTFNFQSFRTGFNQIACCYLSKFLNFSFCPQPCFQKCWWKNTNNIQIGLTYRRGQLESSPCVKSIVFMIGGQILDSLKYNLWNIKKIVWLQRSFSVKLTKFFTLFCQ